MTIYKIDTYKEIPQENFNKDIIHYHKKKDIEEINHFINKKSSYFDNYVKFSYLVDEETGKIRIRVYNFQTGETIQEIPSEKFLKFIKELKNGISEEELRKMEFLPTGIFFDKNT